MTLTLFFITVSYREVQEYIYADGEDYNETDDEANTIESDSICSFGESTSVEDNWVVEDHMEEERNDDSGEENDGKE